MFAPVLPTLLLSSQIQLTHSQQTHNMTTITEAGRKTTIVPPSSGDFSARQQKTIRLYPVTNYTFGTKEAQPEEDPSVSARLQRLQDQYEQYGIRRTCEGVLVCHEHGHPHILMLQIANAFFKLYFSSLLFDSILLI